MAVKSYIPGTVLNIGYETENADRASIRCLVTGEASMQAAITAAVASVGDLLLTGSYNIPLVDTSATHFGNQKWIVTLNYGRGGRSRRRTQTDRRIRIQSVLDYVDAYLIESSTYENGYRKAPVAGPNNEHWYSLSLRPGNRQSPELVPRPYKLQRPTMRITLSYTTSFLTITGGELAKLGKINSNVFPIAELSTAFAANTLKYEGFESDKNDIGTYPWATVINLTYDPAGHYKQKPVWDQSLDSGNGLWTVDNTKLESESTTF